MRKVIVFALSLFCLSISDYAFAWHDKTHISIAKAAGYENWFNAAGADITKTKAGDKESTNHWFNNNAGAEVTGQMVLDQASRYNNPTDAEGHLYGAIISSLQEYINGKNAGKYAEYNMAFCAHYIGDLSNPMHNAPHRSFLKDHHTANDATIEAEVMNNVDRIQKELYDIKITNQEDLANQIARIATISNQLALKLEKENRDMTTDEAYTQAIHSASLVKAALSYASKKQN